MDFKKINIDQIVSIRCYINYTSNHYVYKKAKKYFSFLFPKEGWYYTFTLGSSEFRTVEQIESSGEMFVKDGYVYFYPHLEMRMSNGTLATKYFKTSEELKEFYDENLSQLNLIDL